MSDLIDRDALRLMKAKECAGHTIEYAQGWKACIEWIKTLPSADPERKWIPVTERLPEEDIDVLLQFPHTMGVGYQEDGFWNIVTCDDLYSGLDEADAIAGIADNGLAGI